MRRTTKASQPLKSKIEVPWDTTGVANAGSPQSMPLDQIVLPPNQPRRYFDSEALKQLTESIKQHGILQPVLVRPLDGEKHELVAGERRYRAAKEIGLKVVPVVIRELDDNAAFQFALIENLLREDLNPVEETEGILQLLSLKLGRSVEDIPHSCIVYNAYRTKHLQLPITLWAHTIAKVMNLPITLWAELKVILPITLSATRKAILAYLPITLWAKPKRMIPTLTRSLL